MMFKSQVCCRCGEKSPQVTERELRERGWSLVDLASFNGHSGGYTLLSWCCGDCRPRIDNVAPSAS